MDLKVDQAQPAAEAGVAEPAEMLAVKVALSALGVPRVVVGGRYPLKTAAARPQPHPLVVDPEPSLSHLGVRRLTLSPTRCSRR